MSCNSKTIRTHQTRIIHFCPSDMVTAMLSDLDPVAVILVSSGTKGNRLLFRYPYFQEPHSNHKSSKVAIKNPYATNWVSDIGNPTNRTSSILTLNFFPHSSDLATRKLASVLSAKPIMMAAFEEASVTGDEDTVSPLKQIIHNSNLAKELMSVFDNLVKSGQVLFFLNQWVEINFCLLHKIHANVPGGVLLETFYRFLTYVRPYHAILLTKPEQELLSSLPLDGCPSLSRLIKLTTPVKNLKILALETDLSITQIYQLVCHMVYWGFAILIYPMCQANQYVLSPSADTAVVVWMLRHRILNQLHTYVNLLPSSKKEFPTNPNMCHSTISSTHSSSSSVQVVEESYLSILMEDPTTSNLDRATSMSDVASVNSEESGGQSTTQYTSQLSKSPSHEANSDCSMLPEDSKLQWRMQDNLLNELKPGVKAAILRCPAAKNFEDLSLFAKLVPYFNGKHHLEEIMFYENLTRSQLVTLLEKFKDVLILSSHEALATTLI
uniref:GATOR complex protein NPRL3 n=1 Tax=Biomphalaria glabrata TaxID=6526 RepID=A0A2C9KRC0_BIOGL